MLSAESTAEDMDSQRRLAIEAKSLTKVYPPSTRAVDSVTFHVYEGEIFGLLGPNGAGKTTTIKMITTLTRPTSGDLLVFGVSVKDDPERVRSMLGYVPQSVSVDANLSAYENLLIFSKLFFVSRKDRKARIREALDYMGLGDRADELVKNYSGGMMRRLEIAQTLVNRPRMLFLDEPSIGLDPNSRRDVWRSVLQLREQYDTTIFITTHDMAEADALCDRLAIMDEGRIAASGTPQSLKRSVGGDVLTVVMSEAADPPPIPPDLGMLSYRDGKTLEIIAENGDEAVPKVVGLMNSHGVGIDSISTRRPGLDDAFMKYTKRKLNEVQAASDARSARRSFTRHAG